MPSWQHYCMPHVTAREFEVSNKSKKQARVFALTPYFAFMDLDKAFDRIPCDVVRRALRTACIEEGLLKLP